MAVPVNSQQQVKPKAPTVNLPMVQPGQLLPMHPSAIQQPAPPAQQQAPQPMQQAAPTQQPPLQPQAPKPPSFSPEQAAALAAQPVPQTPDANKIVDPIQTADVVQGAQEKALGGFQSEEYNLLNQRVNELLQDPSLGRNPELAKQIALDEYNKNQAQAIEAFRQQTGNIAGSGNIDEMLLAKNLEAAEGRTELERKMELEEQELKRKDMFDALAAGSQNVQMQSAIQTGDIDNMINAAGGALGFADLAMRENIALSELDYNKTRDGLTREHDLLVQSGNFEQADKVLEKQLAFEDKQAELGREFTAGQNAINNALKSSLAHLDVDSRREFLGLKAKIDKDMLITSADLAAAEGELERLSKEAIANKSIDATFALQEAQNAFSTLKAEADREYNTAERQAIQAYQTGENVTDREYKKGMQLLNIEHDLALQNNDQEHADRMNENIQKFELHVLTQNMEHNEKMAHINAEIDKAASAEDFDREKILIGMATEERIKVMAEQGRIDEALANLQGDIQQELNQGGYDNALVMQKINNDQQWQIHLDDQAMEQVYADLAKFGAKGDAIQKQIEAGNLDPSEAVRLIQHQFPGFAITTPDPMAVQKALDEDWKNQQYQYALIQGNNPDGTLAAGKYDANGNFLGLADEHLEKFNHHLNTTIYNEAGGVAQSGEKITEDNYTVDIDGNDRFMRFRENGSVVNDPTRVSEIMAGSANVLSQNNRIYNDMLASAPAPDIRIDSPRKNTLSDVPIQGAMVNVGGRLMMVTKGKHRDDSGRNSDAFEIMDVSSGTRRTFDGKKKSDRSVSGLNDWAASFE